MRLVLPLVIALTLSGAQALAQSTEFDKSIASVMLLTIEPVKKELKLSEAQRAKMNAAAKPLNEFRNKMFKKQEEGKQPTEAELKQLDNLTTTMRTKVLAELSKVQLKRLREITLQDAGLVAIATPEVAKELGISASSLKSIRSALDNGADRVGRLMQLSDEKVRKAFAGKNPKTEAEARKLQQQADEMMRKEADALRPQITKIENETQAKVMSLLSKAQQTKYKALLGAPFKAN